MHNSKYITTQWPWLVLSNVAVCLVTYQDLLTSVAHVNEEQYPLLFVDMTSKRPD